MFKAARYLFFGLIAVCAPPWGPALSAPPHLLFTKEIHHTARDERFTYTVRTGDHLYAILRSFNVPEAKMGTWVRKVLAINPKIKDPDTLYPGTRLQLPAALRRQEPPTSPPAANSTSPGPIQSIPHTVTSPATAGTLLRRQIPDATPSKLDRYKDLFSAMNPGLDPSSPLSPGRTVYLPRPVHRAAKRSPAPSEAGTGHTAASKTKALPEGKVAVLSQLSSLGLNFAHGDDILSPCSDGSWLRLNLDRMLLASTPWENHIALIPEGTASGVDTGAFARAGITVCPVPSSWSPSRVYAALENTCPAHFLSWTPNAPMILSRPGVCIELRAKTLLAVTARGQRRMAVFSSSPEHAKEVPSPLFGFLQDQGIRVFLLDQQAGRPVWEAQQAPPKQALFIPTISGPKFLRNLKERGLLPPGIAGSPDPVLNLIAGGLLSRHTLHLSWPQWHGISITLHADVLRMQHKDTDTFFIPRAGADPYLVALLNLMGYSVKKLDF